MISTAMMSTVSTDPVARAACWLAEQHEPPVNVIAVMKDRFGITAVQVAKACTLASEHRRTKY